MAGIDDEFAKKNLIIMTYAENISKLAITTNFQTVNHSFIHLKKTAMIRN